MLPGMANIDRRTLLYAFGIESKFVLEDCRADLKSFLKKWETKWPTSMPRLHRKNDGSYGNFLQPTSLLHCLLLRRVCHCRALTSA
jgi:hypothetical protein